ncbi:MAG: caspase family protein [Candidatus Hodarchaeales archaeon]
MRKMKTHLIIGVITIALFLAFLNGSIAVRASSNTRVPPWLRNNSPTVIIQSPTNGETVSGITLVTVDATDPEDGALTADIYIDDVFVAHANTYEWDTTGYSDGSHTIKATAVDSEGSSDTDTITVYIGSGGSDGDGIVNKYAVIVGISDYKAISDLSYCDEDATDWYNYLAPLGYQITLLGDSHPENYPQYDGYATEANVRAALANMFASADADDIVAFISSGHGGESSVGVGRNRYYVQFLCMWDCASGEDGYDGYIYDDEFESIMSASVSQTFVFLDHCFSGGIAFLRANSYMTTTCTDDGYGYDDSTHLNGAWTYWFLEYTLIGHFGGTASMEDTFAYALGVYPYGGGDTPQEFDGYTGLFYL